MERALERAIAVNQRPTQFHDSRHFTNWRSPRDDWLTARANLGLSPEEFKEFLQKNGTLINKMHVLHNFANSHIQMNID